MAILKEMNLLLQGITGRLGNIVIRRRNGKTIVCKAPVSRKTKPTEQQYKLQHRFSVCSKVASKAIKDKATKDYYQAQAAGSGRSAYNMAFTDAIRAYDEGALSAKFKL